MGECAAAAIEGGGGGRVASLSSVDRGNNPEYSNTSVESSGSRSRAPLCSPVALLSAPGRGAGGYPPMLLIIYASDGWQGVR